MPFEESYFTVRYDEAKKEFPNTFGFDIGLSKWIKEPANRSLRGYNFFVPMAEQYNRYVIQRYEQREISAETPERWMWFLDRKLSRLCEKYGETIKSCPEFTLANVESTHDIQNKNHQDRNFTDKTDAHNSTIDGTSVTTTDNLTHTTTDKSENTHQDYPHNVSPDISKANTTSGNYSEGTNELKDTGTVTVKNEGDVKYNIDNTLKQTGFTEGHDESTDTYKLINDKVLRWQELLHHRRPLIDHYTSEFNDLFISVIGLQLAPRSDLRYWGLIP